MASKNERTKIPFTRWHSNYGLDDKSADLALVVDRAGQIEEWVDLDIRELPERSDLLERLGPVTRDRLVRDAHDARKTLGPASTQAQ